MTELATRSSDIEIKLSDEGSDASLRPPSFVKATTVSTKKKAADAEVEEQSEKLHTRGTIWNAVLRGSQDEVLEILKADPERLLERGAVGETPFMLAFLFRHLDLAKTLCNKFPSQMTVIYEGDVYHGENVLHIVIVNRDLDTVKRLLERADSAQRDILLRAQADGLFFQEGKPCYFGEFPLSFAVCSNNQPMVKYLLSAGADLYAQDSNGNTVLHLCVIHKLQEMYTFLVKEDNKRRAKLEEENAALESKGHTNVAMPERLASLRNKELLTPVTLATVLGDQDMFTFLLDSGRETMWSYGPVSCNMYPLNELDFLPARVELSTPPKEESLPRGLTRQQKDAHIRKIMEERREKLDQYNNWRSALEIIVKEEKLDLLMLPRVLDLLTKKWERFAQKAFNWRFVLTLLYAVLFTLAVVFRANHEQRGWYGAGSYDFSDGRTYGRLLLELIVVFVAFWKGYKEMGELIGIGISKYFGVGGVAFLENTLSVGYVCSIVAVIICRFISPDAEDVALVLATLLIWGYAISMTLVFKLTGPFLVMMAKIFKGDVVRFITVLVFILCSFATVFYILDTSDVEGSKRWFDWVEYLFMAVLGNWDMETVTGVSPLPWFSVALIVLFVVIVTIMLLNLLIAMMGNTFNEVFANAVLLWHLAVAQIIFAVENELSMSQLHELGQSSAKYWVEAKGVQYLQVEEVDPEWARVGAVLLDESEEANNASNSSEPAAPAPVSGATNADPASALDPLAFATTDDNKADAADDHTALLSKKKRGKGKKIRSDDE